MADDCKRCVLRTPELVLACLDPRIAATEPDPGIQDLLRSSEALNVGMDFLPWPRGSPRDCWKRCWPWCLPAGSGTVRPENTRRLTYSNARQGRWR